MHVKGNFKRVNDSKMLGCAGYESDHDLISSILIRGSRIWYSKEFVFPQ